MDGMFIAEAKEIALLITSAILQAGQQARKPKQSSKPWVMKGKKRSEVDRRLDILIGPSGKLRDGSTTAVIGMLRLFNLCDVAPTITQPDMPRRDRETRTTSPVRTLAPTLVQLFHQPPDDLRMPSLRAVLHPVDQQVLTQCT